mmetsp:Transcript_26903/g.63855  ORF Transcript_26903/g.63855 Transcript_26903/m.63855 type:complete len:236 (-) Transcript_26903:574-1281(-)
MEGASKLKISSLTNFEVERVLSDDIFSKYVAVLGRFRDDDNSDCQAILRLSRRHFDLENLPALFSSGLQLDLDFHNDIYSKFAALPSEKFNYVTVDAIYPCTSKHISKFERKPVHMVRETPELYRNAILPYIESIPAAQTQWVVNILEGKAEVERVIFMDDNLDSGFVLLPDLKWDQIQANQLYCVAIAQRRDVRSLRDLTAQHLPLLENIIKQGSAVIQVRSQGRKTLAVVFPH